MSLFRRRDRQPRPAAPDLAPEPKIDERGWEAITAAVALRYPGAEDFHVAYPPGVHFGSALQGCSALAGADHWFYVSYGLTELWTKQSDDPTTRGYGFELTIRVPRTPEQDAPPQWPYGLVVHLAEYVRGGPQPLWIGDRVRLGGPVIGGPDSALTTVTVTPDVEVLPIDTPNGRVELWQLVGLTDAEVAAAQESSTADVLAAMARSNPLLITDPDRS
jgi:hypothetical protein